MRQFRRFRRRHLWVRGWDLFLESAFVMTVAAGAVLLLDRLLFELGLSGPVLSLPGRLAVILGLTLVLAGGIALATLLMRPTPPVEIAWRLDRATGGEERFLSALEVAASGGDGRFGEALCRDAVRRAEAAEPARVLPGAPVGYRWAILLSLLTGGVLYAWPPRIHRAPAADFDASPVRGPAPLEVSFRDASIGVIGSFEWEFGDGQEGRGERTVHLYETPGTYEARLRLRGPGGLSEATRTIEVLSPDRPAAEFDAAPRKGRAPLRVRFVNRSLNADRLEWDFGDGAGSDEEDPVHTYDAPGVYTVRLRAANALYTDARVREGFIRVVHPGAPLANFRALPKKGAPPLEVSFEDLSIGEELSEWEWDFGDPGSGDERTSGERNPVHIYRTPGRYDVRLRVRGKHGEDVEVKERYIEVREDGPGNGGGRGPVPKPPSAAGGREGELFGTPEPPPESRAIPEHVKHHKPGQGLAPKELNVYVPSEGGKGAPQQVPLETALPQVRRSAEDSITRERIPAGLRDFVRTYYAEFPE